MNTQQLNTVSFTWQEAKESYDEGWRDVPGYEGLYQAKEDGSVRRVKGYGCKETRTLNPSPNTDGYLVVSLSQNGHVRTYGVHELIALVFIGPRPAGMHVNHIDLDRQNNRADNLEYLTPLENVRHSIRQRGRWSAKLTEEQVRQIRSRYNGAYGQIARLAREYGVTPANLWCLVNGRSWRDL